MSFKNLAVEGDGAVFHVQLSNLGLAAILVEGTLTLDGILQIIDTAAPDGLYDITDREDFCGPLPVWIGYNVGADRKTKGAIPGRDIPLIRWERCVALGPLNQITSGGALM